MASTLFRTVSTISRNVCRLNTVTKHVRLGGSQTNVGFGINPPHREKITLDGGILEGGVPSGAGHRVGLEKWEIAAIEQDIMDPFGIETRVMAEGTFDNPNIVPSVESRRIIGCICDPDSDEVIWTWLEKGEPRRCMCGHWFKLVELDEDDIPK